MNTTTGARKSMFDFEQEENILIEKATKRKEEELLKEINTEKAYKLHKEILEDCFIRMSSANKGKFIVRLLDSLNNDSDILEITNFISLGDAKPFIYTGVNYQSSLKYDIDIIDHDRCLNQKELQETIENEVQWFKSLSDDKQVDVVISLITRSGGSVQKNLLLPFLKKCFTQERHHKMMKESTRKEKSRTITSPSQDTIQFADHPESINVENQRKKWDQIISIYREKVQGPKPKAEKVEDKKRGKKDKIKSKKEKKDKGQKEKGNDWIQLLPIWNVKQIFDYLDQKTLNTVKKVSPYWSAVVKEVIKDRNTRTKINKEIETLKAEIGEAELAEALEIDQMEQAVAKRAAKRTRTRKYERGAILKKLVPKPVGNLAEHSVYASAKNEVTENFFTDTITSFPRKMDEGGLYKYKPCFLKDINVVLGDDKDINETTSFVTYSLSTHSETLSLSVDKETLEDW